MTAKRTHAAGKDLHILKTRLKIETLVRAAGDISAFAEDSGFARKLQWVRPR